MTVVMAQRTPTMRRFALRDLTTESWRNGGGVTRVVARGAGTTGAGAIGAGANGPGTGNQATDADGWTWRVSVADITRDGPFSRFPGAQRQLRLMHGAGFELRGEHRVWRAAQLGDVLVFSGDEPVHAHLLGGPVRVWNLMLRGQSWRGQLRTWTHSAHEWVQPFAMCAADELAAAIVFALEGDVAVCAATLADGLTDMALAEGEGVCLVAPPAGLRLQLAAAGATALVTEIYAAAPAA